MPKYSFECANSECSLQFDRILKMGDHITYPCPSCGVDAPRVIDGGFAFSFDVAPAKEGNSGVHKEDYPKADHAVGRDAERRWGVIHERNKVKEEVRAKGGTGALIRRDRPGYTEYVAMPPQVQADHRVIAKKASRALELAKRGQR